MRTLVFILLSVALPAHADLGQMMKDALRHEIERRMPVPTTQGPVRDSEHAPKPEVRYNLHWRLSGRVGPFTYRDDRLEDRYIGRFGFRPQGGIKAFRPENMQKLTIEIRKDF